MKSLKVGLMVLAFSTMIFSGAFAADKNGQIGYVDLSRLFDEYQKTKDYDKVLESKHSDFEKERNSKIESIRDQENKLGMLAEDKKAALQKDLDKAKADLLEYDKQKKTDLTKERNEKIREILLEIEKIVSDYAEKNNYSVILNDRVLIYGEKTMDLTEEILKILNQGQAASKDKK